MKKLGIIAEYNPFHNGHKYMIEEARRISGADICVAAMSGNFVQRGEPAVLDKWTRAELALSYGIDLVLEIPTSRVLADAGRYASAGVDLLKRASCDAIAFGSECGDADLLRKIARRLDEHADSIALCIAEARKLGLNYPAARQKAYTELFGDTDPDIEKDISVLSSSNDILAIEYIIAAGDMEVYPIKRIGADYLDDIQDDEKYQSATGIRQAVSTGEDIRGYVPELTAVALKKAESNISKLGENYFNFARAAVISMSEEELENTPSGGEGLASRLRRPAISADSIKEMIDFAKSKRYTYTRVARMIAQAVLEIKRNDADMDVMYARVLGFNGAGRKLLADLRDSEFPVITNINKEMEKLEGDALRQLELDIKASDFYNIMCIKSLYSNSDRVMRPIIKE